MYVYQRANCEYAGSRSQRSGRHCRQGQRCNRILLRVMTILVELVARYEKPILSVGLTVPTGETLQFTIVGRSKNVTVPLAR